ncbi:glycosyltransferase family 4 protein [Ornithinimicrobium sp. Y1847]|uniref:glycosyltransferase family 4 protein n=1 Tax=Ornithinimicrobium sp. Y1847 TaxID=3405419 RepID=UPI003B6767A2
MQDLGYELVEVPPANLRVHRKVRDVLEHRSGRPMDKTFRSARKAAGADIVFAFLEREALAASWAKRHRVPPYCSKPLVMLSCWLAEELRTMTPEERRSVVRSYSGVDLILVWSSNQVDLLIEAGFASDRVEAINFGFAPGFFPPADVRARSGVLAIGADRGRDYGTLMSAVAGTGIQVDLYAGQGNVAGLTIPDEVTFHGRVPYEEYRRLVAAASVVTVPTVELAYPTGQTVALEAAATGACVILTDTPAIREYFSEDTALMVPPLDVDGWQGALRLVTQDQKFRENMGRRASDDVHARFTYLQMWQQVDRLLRVRGWTRQ